MSFIVIIILAIVVVFIVINFQEPQKKQKVSQHQNHTTQESENNQEERQDTKIPRPDLFDDFFDAFQSEPKNKRSSSKEKYVPQDNIVNSPVVAWSKNPDQYGIPIGFSEGIYKQRTVVLIRPRLYKYYSQTLSMTIFMNEFDENEVFIPPKNNKFYVLEQISQSVKNCYLNIVTKSEYLSRKIIEIENLKKQAESNIYLQQSRLYPQNIDEIYNLRNVGGDLYNKHHLFIYNILTGDNLIKYDVKNFPDISDELIQLARECDDFSSQFEIIKNEIDTYENLKGVCPTLREIYSYKFRVEFSELLD